MKPTARQQVPPPVLVMPPAAEAPKKRAPTVPAGTGIELVEPTIVMDKNRFVVDVSNPDGPLVQADTLKPKFAVIVDAAVVIDEMGLVIPLSSCFIRTKRS